MKKGRKNRVGFLSLFDKSISCVLWVCGCFYFSAEKITKSQSKGVWEIKKCRKEKYCPIMAKHAYLSKKNETAVVNLLKRIIITIMNNIIIMKKEIMEERRQWGKRNQRWECLSLSKSFYPVHSAEPKSKLTLFFGTFFCGFWLERERKRKNRNILCSIFFLHLLLLSFSHIYSRGKQNPNPPVFLSMLLWISFFPILFIQLPFQIPFLSSPPSLFFSSTSSLPFSLFHHFFLVSFPDSFLGKDWKFKTQKRTKGLYITHTAYPPHQCQNLMPF